VPTPCRVESFVQPPALGGEPLNAHAAPQITSQCLRPSDIKIWSKLSKETPSQGALIVTLADQTRPVRQCLAMTTETLMEQ
jgi:hypothetical protein